MADEIKYTENTNIICQQALNVVLEAAKFIRSNFNLISEADVAEKGQNSLVSFVDKESEKILVNGLCKIIPDAGFITEEEMVEQSRKRWTWIIDPLDGTTNFLCGAPYFSVSIALYDGQNPIVGIVHEVMHREVFHAIQGRGSWLNGVPIRTSPKKSFHEILVGTGFPYHTANTQHGHFSALQEVLSKTRGIRRFGSAALDLCYVACGRFGAFYENALNAYDIAAGALIVQEAGGVITDFRGENNWLEKGEILATAPQFQKEMLKITSVFNET
jgi:myo-inositol-1(or 4)-monophosphatase